MTPGAGISRRRGRHYENERVLLVCYAPPAAHVSKMSDLFFASDGRKRQPTQRRIVEYFNEHAGQVREPHCRCAWHAADAIVPVTDAVGDPGRQDELVNYLNFCATGRVQGVMLPKAGAYLDLLIASQEVSPGENPIIGRDYVGVVAIDGIPGESQPNILAALNTLAMPYRFSQRTDLSGHRSCGEGDRAVSRPLAAEGAWPRPTHHAEPGRAGE